MDRIFTLSEANQLIPKLEEHLKAVKKGKAILAQTKPEIKKASAKAHLNGGSFAGPHYILALEEVTRHFHDIQELGVHVKDLDLGLCDFPYRLQDRIVYLCWKIGESEIRWWHDIHSGYRERQLLEEIDC